MAVAFNSSGNYRADFMAAEASNVQRVKASQTTQDNGFSKVLNSQQNAKKQIGSVNSSGSVNTSSAANNSTSSVTLVENQQSKNTLKINDAKAELERVCEVLEKEALVLGTSENVNEIADDAFALSDDVMDLAKKIVSGEIDIEDVPIEQINVELLLAVALVKKNDVSDACEDGDQETVSDLTDRVSKLGNVLVASADQIISEIMLILDMNSQEALLERIDAISSTIAEQGESFLLSADMAEQGAVDATVNYSDSTEFQSVEISENAAENTASLNEKPQITDKLKSDKAVASATNTQKAETDSEGNVIVRKVTHSEEKNEFSQEQNNEQSSFFGQKSGVSKEISEELEMLRNAKLSKSKPEDEFSVEQVKDNADEAAPVRTASPLTAESPIVLAGNDGAMVEVRPSEIMSQVTKLVEQAVSENRESMEYSMVLNPEELGRITVKLVKAADGSVSVTIAAENSSTQRLLEQNSELMQNNLRSNGVQLQSWQTVNEAHQETMQREYDGSSKNPYYREENENADDEQSEDVSFAEIIAAM